MPIEPLVMCMIFFSFHGAGETDAQINADNCGEQNKNNFVVWYYSWRILLLTAQINIVFVFDRGTYKIEPRLVFWIDKAVV